MSQTAKIITGVICLVVASIAGTAAAVNAMQPPVPQAGGVTVGGLDLVQLFNYAVTALGGASGIWALVSGLLTKISPNLSPILNSGEVNQFIAQLPQVIALVSGGNGSMVLDVNEKIGSVTVTGQLKVSRGTIPPAA
jgi:hypothetical protein